MKRLSHFSTGTLPQAALLEIIIRWHIRSPTAHAVCLGAVHQFGWAYVVSFVEYRYTGGSHRGVFVLFVVVAEIQVSVEIA